MAATLTRELLDDLHKGMTAISLLPYPDGTGVDFSTLKFEGADQIFTIKDSFSLTPNEPTVEDQKIDQNDETIDTVVTEGEYTMSGNIPLVAVVVLSYFMNEVATVTGLTGQDGETYSGKSYDTAPREVVCSVLLESQSKKSAVAFAKVKFVVPGVAMENASGLAYVPFTGRVLANSMAGKGNFAVLKKTAAGA